MICPDSGYCMAFGREVDKMKFLFAGFKELTAMKRIKPISKGANGFVVRIDLEQDNIVVPTILKSNLGKGDSLLYEAHVGLQYLNAKGKFFPCFMETYSAYFYKDKALHAEMAEAEPRVSRLDMQGLKNINPKSDDLLKMYLKLGCSGDNFSRFAVLVESLPTPLTLYKFILNFNDDSTLFSKELPTILYQVYKPLSKLMNEFTHYDLHVENVLLYELPDNQYVRMSYQDGTDRIEFNTRFIVKIIDYGRCFFKGNDKFFDVMDTKCPDAIDRKIGFGFTDPSLTEQNYFMSSRLLNISHDLRLAHLIREVCADFAADQPLFKNVLSTVYYTDDYGTAPMESFNDGTDIIVNVGDLSDRIEKFMQTTDCLQINDAMYADRSVWKQVGTMTVDTNQRNPVEFTQ